MIRLGNNPRRLALLAVALWIVLELLVLKAMVGRIGIGLTLTLLILKGGLGLVVLGILMARSARKLGQEALGSFGFRIASGVLIALPGFVATLLGLALFSPSLRGFIASLISRQTSQSRPDDVLDLSPDQWSESTSKPISRQGRARPRRTRLERDPPTV